MRQRRRQPPPHRGAQELLTKHPTNRSVAINSSRHNPPKHNRAYTGPPARDRRKETTTTSTSAFPLSVSPLYKGNSLSRPAETRNQPVPLPSTAQEPAPLSLSPAADALRYSKGSQGRKGSAACPHRRPPTARALAGSTRKSPPWNCRSLQAGSPPAESLPDVTADRRPSADGEQTAQREPPPGRYGAPTQLPTYGRAA